MPIASVMQVLIMFAFPVIVLETVKRNKMAGMIGPVILCYALGLIVGNLPESPVNVGLSQSVAEVAVPLAISLMLLSTRFVAWLKYAKRTAFAFFLGVVGVLMAALVSSAVFHYKGIDVTDMWKVSGMMVGVYIGGTPNMAAIGTMLGVPNETFIVMNACDLVLSGIYLALLLTVAQRFALQFLPSFVRIEGNDRDETFHYQRYQQMASKTRVGVSLTLALLLAVAIVGVSIGFSFLVAGKITAPNVMLGVTTLSIAASFVRKIRFLPRTYEFGEYFLLVFCLGIGSISNMGQLLQGSSSLLLFMTCILVLSITFHFLLARLFKVDADTMLITSVAGIFGPAFIGPVASVLKNKDIVVGGLTTGLVGYAIANFLGFGMAHLMHWLFY
jgi:uncharacterized membrane protein